MIRVIFGTVASSEQGGIILQTSGGLGYFIHTTKRLAVLPGDTLTLSTHLAVRENSLDLYGFFQEKELSLFELLLTIPKIGPKSALQILDQATPELLLEAITLSDHEYLSKQSGMGKKTAEKVVIALKDKISNLAHTPIASTQLGSSLYQDAFDTLITLGYSPNAIRTVLESITGGSTSDIVKQALKELS